MNSPSKEQQNIIQQVQENYNVIVDSVAGSGKTTTILHIAKHNPTKRILNLTYNANLKIETREKVINYEIPNIEIHSYHSFCVKYYNHECFTDNEIIKILKTDKQPKKGGFYYDLFILDETQDMTPIYYELFCKIYINNKHKETQICVFGDEKQSIFSFNKADPRFITFCDKLMNFNAMEWKRCRLNVSFRITQPMSDFINNVCFGYDRIISTKESVHKPEYIICNPFHNVYKLVDIIDDYLKLGYNPDDIFILSPSVRGSERSPIRHLENKFKTIYPDVPIFVPKSDGEKVDSDVLKNKMVFMTFHQSKGLERKVVFVMNFEESYSLYYNQNYEKTICPNELYVAITRASERLVLIHDFRNRELGFIKSFENIHKYVNYIEVCSLREPKDTKITSSSSICVLDLLRHTPSCVLNKCFEYLKITTLNEPVELGKSYKIAKKVNTTRVEDKNITEKEDENENEEEDKKIRKTFEDVSTINGLAMQFYCEYKINNTIETFDNIKTLGDENTKTLTFETFEKTNGFSIEKSDIYGKLKENDIKHLLQFSNCWESIKSKFLYCVQQLTSYEWVNYNVLEKYNDLFLSLLNEKNIISFETDITNKKSLIFEKCVSSFEARDTKIVKILEKYKKTDISGYIDFVYDDKLIFELKCVTKLTIDHYLQLALYMYLYEATYNYNSKNQKQNQEIEIEPKNSYYIYNFCTNELHSVSCSYQNLENIFLILMDSKFSNEIKLSDEEFFENINVIKSRWFYSSGIENTEKTSMSVPTHTILPHSLKKFGFLPS